MMFRCLFYLIGFTCALPIFGQFSPGLTLDFFYPKTDLSYEYVLSNYNDNETFTYYKVDSDLKPIGTGFSIRNYGGQFLSDRKIAVGYSLEIGFRKFSSSNRLNYKNSSTENRDSIISEFHGLNFTTNFNTVQIANYFDFHWNVTDKIKISQSIGVCVSAFVKINSPNSNINSTAINTNLPILKLFYQPQITEAYERFSISYFASIDCFSWEIFKNSASNTYNPSEQIPYSKIRMNSIGIRILPNLNKKKAPIEQ